MYQLVKIEDTVRVPPRRFSENLESVLLSEIDNTLAGRVDRDIGIILAAKAVEEVGDGKMILGDGAVYYDCKFDALVFHPQLNEVVEGEVTEITEFGAFVNFGPIDGLIHISQITEDFMNYDAKSGVLVGKESGKTLKVGDQVRSRVVTISLRDRVSDSKIGLTMRQPYLGKTEWLADEQKQANENAEKAAEKAAKSKGKGKKAEKKDDAEGGK